MSLDLSDPAVARVHRGLAPYARGLLEHAADTALFVHADEVTVEHLLAALMDDESCAAHRTVLFAFADPETISVESLATAPGILVVGSAQTLPFSTSGVLALRDARRIAVLERAGSVAPSHLLRAAVSALAPDPRAALASAGYRDPPPEPPGTTPLPDEGPLFRAFGEETRRLLALAAREATRRARSAIAPAHLVLACAERDERLRERAGVGPAAVRAAVAGRDEDLLSVPERRLPPAADLLGFLTRTPPEADSLELLRAFVVHGKYELAEILRRNRVTPELLERARPAFFDP